MRTNEGSQALVPVISDLGGLFRGFRSVKLKKNVTDGYFISFATSPFASGIAGRMSILFIGIFQNLLIFYFEFIVRKPSDEPL